MISRTMRSTVFHSNNLCARRTLLQSVACAVHTMLSVQRSPDSREHRPPTVLYPSEVVRGDGARAVQDAVAASDLFDIRQVLAAGDINNTAPGKQITIDTCGIRGKGDKSAPPSPLSSASANTWLFSDR